MKEFSVTLEGNFGKEISIEAESQDDAVEKVKKQFWESMILKHEDCVIDMITVK